MAQATARRRTSRGRAPAGERDRQREQREETAAETKEAAKAVVVYVDGAFRAKEATFLAALGSNPRLAERMRMVVLHALTHPKLMAKLRLVDPATVIEAAYEAATLGLYPVAATAEGYLVPYWNKAKGRFDIQFAPGYRGLLKLVVDGRRVHALAADVAYTGDDFEHVLGTSPSVRHVIAPSNRGEPEFAWAVGYMSGGIAIPEVLPMAEIEKVMRSSKAADDGPWVEWPDEMRKKTVLRRLMKDLPLGELAERALWIENEAESRYQRPPSGMAFVEASALPAIDAARAAVLGSGSNGHGADAQQGATPAGDPGPTETPVTPSDAPRAVTDGQTSGECGPSVDPVGDTQVCTKPKGHDGPHKNADAVWPQAPR